MKGWDLLLQGLSGLTPALLDSTHSPWSLCIQAGKFNIIPTIISSVAAFTSVGVVSSAPPGSDWSPVRARPLLAGVDRELNPGKPCFSLE